MIFRDRNDAGRQLAARLNRYMDEKPFVIALARGGVVVGYEVAKALKSPLDVIVPRKLGTPMQPELGFGAIAPNSVRLLNNEIVRWMGITEAEIERVTAEETREMERRMNLYRDGTPAPDVRGRTVIIVDDGLATGYTAMAAIMALRQMRPRKIILAVPVSSIETAERISSEVDEFVCIETPPDFMAVGAWYQRFEQVGDEEVVSLLHQAREELKIAK